MATHVGHRNRIIDLSLAWIKSNFLMYPWHKYINYILILNPGKMATHVGHRNRNNKFIIYFLMYPWHKYIYITYFNNQSWQNGNTCGT